MARWVSLATLAFLLALAASSALWIVTRGAAAPPAQQTKTYQPGWANISWVGYPAPIEEAFAPVLDSVAVIYQLNDVTGAWERYVPGRPDVSDLTAVSFGGAYMVLFTKAATIPVLTEPPVVYVPIPGECEPGECDPGCSKPRFLDRFDFSKPEECRILAEVCDQIDELSRKWRVVKWEIDEYAYPFSGLRRAIRDLESWQLWNC